MLKGSARWLPKPDARGVTSKGVDPYAVTSGDGVTHPAVV